MSMRLHFSSWRPYPTVPKAQVYETISHMERATATRPKSQLAANDLFSQFFEVDRELVQWFTSVARREVETGSVPTKKEMEWIKLIHRFYHSYVPYLQAHYAETRLPETCRVYIAHCLSLIHI